MMSTIRRVISRLLGSSRVSRSWNPVHGTAPLAELGNQSFVRTTAEPAPRETGYRIRTRALEDGREPFDLMGEDW